MLTTDDDCVSTWRLLRAVPPGDWVAQAIIPSVVLGWGLWIRSWIGIWFGLCGLLYFALLHVVYPVRGRSHAEYGRLLPGVGLLCGGGFLAGMAWTLIVTDGATDAIVLGWFLALCALLLVFAASVFLWTPLARRFGLAPKSPVIESDPGEWPEPPPYAGGWM